MTCPRSAGSGDRLGIPPSSAHLVRSVIAGHPPRHHGGAQSLLGSHRTWSGALLLRRPGPRQGTRPLVSSSMARAALAPSSSRKHRSSWHVSRSRLKISTLKFAAAAKTAAAATCVKKKDWVEKSKMVFFFPRLNQGRIVKISYASLFLSARVNRDPNKKVINEVIVAGARRRHLFSSFFSFRVRDIFHSIAHSITFYSLDCCWGGGFFISILCAPINSVSDENGSLQF